MDPELLEFLSSYVSYGDFNFISMLNNNKAKYQLNRNVLPEFWDLYSQRLIEEKQNFNSGLGQCIKEFMPIIADIDITIDKEEDKEYNERLYTEEELLKIVTFFYDAIRYVLDDYSPDKLFCFILEKDKPVETNNSNIKNGFHIHFPFIFLSNTDITQHIYPRVAQRIEESKMFSRLGYSHSSDVLDKNIAKAGRYWLLYGSKKDSNYEYYKVTKIFNSRMKECYIKDVLTKNKLFNILHQEIKVDLTKNTSDSYYEYFLPHILNIQPGTRSNYVAKKDIECLEKKKLTKAKNINKLYEHKPIEEVMKISKKLMGMINPKRSDSYEEWIRIGWILYNIGDGCEEAFDMWNDFSKLTSRDNYSEAYCIDQWNNHMHKGNITFGSLRHFAEIDNPELYKEFCIDEKQQQMEASLTGSQTEFVTLVDIQNMSPCSFSNGQNPVSGNQCIQAFTQREKKKKCPPLPKDLVSQVYFTGLACVGIYIFVKIMEKSN